MTNDKTKQISRREIVLAYIFFGIFLLVGAVTLVNVFFQATKGIYALGWPSVNGTILSSRLEQQSGVEGGSDTFFVRINYGYEVNGKSFTGNRIHFGKHGYSSAIKARQKQNDYAAGVKVNIYYNPSDPSESALETGITWVFLITCGGALIFLAFGLGGWYTLHKRIKQKRLSLWLVSVTEDDLDLQRVNNIFQDASGEKSAPSMHGATVKLSSPDEKHVAELIYAGEIRFGPAYFVLELDSRKVKRRIFGNKLAWSDDSRYLALQEWLTTEEKKGPNTRVLLIDLHTRKAAELDIIRGGFPEEFVFKNQVLCYKKHDFSQKKIESAEVEISSIKKWRGLGF